MQVAGISSQKVGIMAPAIDDLLFDKQFLAVKAALVYQPVHVKGVWQQVWCPVKNG